VILIVFVFYKNIKQIKKKNQRLRSEDTKDKVVDLNYLFLLFFIFIYFLLLYFP